MVGLHVIAQQVVPAVVSGDLEAAILRCQPAVEHAGDLDAAVIEVKAAGRLLGPAAGIAVDPHPLVGHRS